MFIPMTSFTQDIVSALLRSPEGAAVAGLGCKRCRPVWTQGRQYEEPCRGDVRPIDGYPPSPLQGSLADHTFNPGALPRPRLFHLTPSGFWTPYRQDITYSPTSFQGSSPSFLPWREPVFQCVKDVMGMNTSGAPIPVAATTTLPSRGLVRWCGQPVRPSPLQPANLPVCLSAS